MSILTRIVGSPLSLISRFIAILSILSKQHIDIRNQHLADKFEFYDIEKLIEQGVSDSQLREIVAEANRYKVTRQSRLDAAFYTQGKRSNRKAIVNIMEGLKC